MHAPALVGRARHHLVEKHELIAVLLHKHLHVAHPRQPVECGELEIVRGKQRATADSALEILHHGLGDGQSVERACAPAHFVEDHEAPRRGPVEDPRRLRHLHEERARAAGEIVTRADPREEPVDDADAGPLRRHEAAGLCQHGHERSLPDERAFAAHVGTGHEQDRRRWMCGNGRQG